jgi:hypothetical protein
MGALAEAGVKNGLPREGESVRGILVTQNFHSKIVAPSDIATYTPLQLGTIASKLHVPFAGSLDMLTHEMFANVTEQLLNNDTNEQLFEDNNVSSESQSKRSPVIHYYTEVRYGDYGSTATCRYRRMTS